MRLRATAVTVTGQQNSLNMTRSLLFLKSNVRLLSFSDVPASGKSGLYFFSLERVTLQKLQCSGSFVMSQIGKDTVSDSRVLALAPATALFMFLSVKLPKD